MDANPPFSDPDDAHTSDAQLRQRAQAKRNQLTSQSVDEKSPEQMRQLAQELQVHQIELEMQYEELLQARTESEAIRNQYIDLYDFAPVGYCTLTRTGEIRQLNLHLSQQLGLTRRQMMGRRLSLFVSPEQRNQFSDLLETVLR